MPSFFIRKENQKPMVASIKRIQHAYFFINVSYTSSLAIFGAVFYLYLQQQGFSFLQINLFGSVFWFVNFLTELPAGIFFRLLWAKSIDDFK